MSDNEFEDWDALVKSPGWQRLVSFVKAQWGAGAYKQKIDTAIAAADEHQRDAMADVKVISRVSSEITLIMNYPQERMVILEKEKLKQAQTPGRRGRL